MKLIALTAVLALVISEVAGEALKNSCSMKWVKYDKTHASGLERRGGLVTEEDCTSACELDNACGNVDFNFVEKSCWFGSALIPASKSPDPAANHWDLLKDCTSSGAPAPAPAPTSGKDCASIYSDNPDSKSGVYTIEIPDGSPTQVYCDMDTPGGGWLVFHRRKDGSGNFSRRWNDYAKGFGNLTREFWLGNNILAAVTQSEPYKLRVDLGDHDGNYVYAEYNVFRVAGPGDKYRLTIGSYTGNGGAGDSMSQNNQFQFSTIDSDNDICGCNCASPTDYNGAWWYFACSYSNLNSNSYGRNEATKGNFWVHWKGFVYALRYSEMKIRPLNR